MHPSAQDIVTVRVAADQRGCSRDCEALETDSAARTTPKDLFTNACSHRLAEANGDFRSLSFHGTKESLEHSPSGSALPSALAGQPVKAQVRSNFRCRQRRRLPPPCRIDQTMRTDAALLLHQNSEAFIPGEARRMQER